MKVGGIWIWKSWCSYGSNDWLKIKIECWLCSEVISYRDFDPESLPFNWKRSIRKRVPEKFWSCFFHFQSHLLRFCSTNFLFRSSSLSLLPFVCNFYLWFSSPEVQSLFLSVLILRTCLFWCWWMKPQLFSFFFSFPFLATSFQS